MEATKQLDGQLDLTTALEEKRRLLELEKELVNAYHWLGAIGERIEPYVGSESVDHLRMAQMQAATVICDVTSALQRL